MIGIIVLILLIIWIIGGIFRVIQDDKNHTLISYAISFTVIYTILQLIYYASINNIIAELKYIDKKIEISEQKSISITEQLKDEVSKYIKYEGTTLKNLKPDNISLLLITYPQLKANETVKQLISEIVKYNNESYSYRYKKQDLLTELYSYKLNTFVLSPVNYNFTD